MDEESAGRISSLFQQARSLPRHKRSNFLDNACREDDSMRAVLTTLLAGDEGPDNVFSGLRSRLSGLRSRKQVVRPAAGGLTAGILVNQYEILERLGHGGMGMVYKARDRRLDRIVALKFISEQRALEEETRKRFHVEARAASSLDHINICTIYEIAETEDRRIYIAMAFCDGDTLQSRIEQGPLPLQRSLDYIHQVGRGLAFAHEHGIVHRDVKPANIVIRQDGVVKIVDFGVAKLADVGLTPTGKVVGTTAYMSPEQARGETVDHRTDIWSMGVVLYEMLTGVRPFQGEYAEAIVYAVLCEEPIPIGALCPTLPLQLVHVIHRMLEKRLNVRYQQIEDVLADIKAIQDRMETRSVTTPALAGRGRANKTGLDRWAVSTAFNPPSAANSVTILVVDDEPEIELLIRQRFQEHVRAGEWEFVFASDGLEAMEALHAHPEVSLILTDIRMPRLDGLALLSQVAELGRPIKTLVMSAYGDMANIRAAMNGGAFDFVMKPIDFADLEATIRKTRDELQSHRKAVEAQHQLVAIKQELEVARRIQDAMQPAPFSKRDDVDVFGFTATMGDVTGDFYDFFAIGDDHIGFLVGDVASRGVSAALAVAVCRTFIRGASMQGRLPGECLSSLNRAVLSDGFPNVSVTIFFADLNVRSGSVSYCNAGHIEPFHMDAQGLVVPLDGTSDPPIWSERDHGYVTHQRQLKSGEAMFLFSDGIPETVDRYGRRFTVDRLRTTVSARHGSPAPELIRRVVRDLSQFSEGTTRPADYAALAIRYHGRAAGRLSEFGDEGEPSFAYS